MNRGGENASQWCRLGATAGTPPFRRRVGRCWGRRLGSGLVLIGGRGGSVEDRDHCKDGSPVAPLSGFPIPYHGAIEPADSRAGAMSTIAVRLTAERETAAFRQAQTRRDQHLPGYAARA